MDYKNCACNEHADILIEEWINRHESAPDLEILDDSQQLSCFWLDCPRYAIYHLNTVNGSDTNED